MGGALHRTRRSFRVLCLPRRGGGWVVREGFPEEVAFAQRFERNEDWPGQVTGAGDRKGKVVEGTACAKAWR